ncbi:MAG: hypothetical protein DMG63_16750 [Acidobacteria bacterium]|nr:MAG: hypothetical protein DMG63_16750 [Acidobacteriota bacterium]
MIRINLLGKSKPKSRRSAMATTAIEFESGGSRASQSGPVDLLTTVSATVNNTDEVWLVAMSDAGNNVNVEGTALSSNAVANLMTNLMKTGYFKTVEIKEAYQDEAEKKLQAFNFSLICEKLPPNAAGKKS